MEGREGLVASAAYQPEPTAAAAARRFVRDTLQAWMITGGAADGHGLVDDAVLLTSELVTNAVVHAGTQVQVTCKLADAGVEVVVSDGHPAKLVPEPPENEHVPAERTSGRGLLLPAALASAWGVTYGRTAKAVWFRIGLAGAETGARLTVSPRDALASEVHPGARAGEDGALTDRVTLAAALHQAPVRLAGRTTGGGATGPGQGVAGTGGSREGLPGTGADPAYAELLTSIAESGRVAVTADAAYVLTADEDGDLRLQAVSGSVSALAAGLDEVARPGSGGPSLAAVRAAVGAAPSVLTAAFVVDDRVTGLLAAASATAGRFSPDEAARLQQIADRCGPSLERARLGELDRVRRGRIAALAEARGLLAGGLSQAAAMALAGQAAVPRLVPWCAVLLRAGEGRLRTAYARHADEARTGALAWLIDRVCDDEPPSAVSTRLVNGHVPAWRWPLAVHGLSDAPARAAELTSDVAWCFPLGPDADLGVLAAGQQRDGRLPREVAELAADLACRVGIALGDVRLAGQKS